MRIYENTEGNEKRPFHKKRSIAMYFWIALPLRFKNYWLRVKAACKAEINYTNYRVSVENIIRSGYQLF
jgi:hypothetical protein